MSEVLRAAIVQARPVPDDLRACLAKAEELVADAARRGAKLVAFGETWFPGYLTWLDHCPAAALWDQPATKETYAKLHDQAVEVPGPTTEELARIARDNGVVIVAGVHERVRGGPGHGTLFAALLTIDADGSLLNHHRKLVPTFTERIVWGPGDALGLRAVGTAAARVGGLICWEHWMPLARQALHDSHEEVHVAVWPSVKEAHQVASRHYAFEGRTFVLAVGQIQRAEDLPPDLDPTDDLRGNPDRLLLDGGSAIIGPNGDYLAGPVFEEETLLVADLDLADLRRESMTLDVTGHYARPDVFRLDVKRERRG